MNIAVIVAGTNEPSNSNLLADMFIEGMEEVDGVNVIKKRLKDMNLQHFDVDRLRKNEKAEEDYYTLKKIVKESSGLVIASPIWNFSVPAHLKNFIDRMGIFSLDETYSKGTMDGKPFYIIHTGGAPFAAWKGLMQKTASHIPQALQYYGASYIGHHFEEKSTAGRGKFALVVDKRPDTLESLKKQGRDFAKVVEEYDRTGKAPVKHRAKKGIMRLGEAILRKIS